MKKVLILLMTLLVSLTGCSKSVGPNDNVTIKWENGVISHDGTVLSVSEYAGYNATIESGDGGLRYRIDIMTAPDVTTLPCNSQGILEENMDKHKGKYYYTEYLGSEFTMANSLGDDMWAVLKCPTNGIGKDLVATYASNYLDDIPMTYGQVYVDFGPFTFGNEYDAVIVRPDCALIAGVAKVSQGSYDCNTPVSIVQGKKEYQVMKGSSASYDYYMYDGYLIQLGAGLDFNSYITFN